MSLEFETPLGLDFKLVTPGSLEADVESRRLDVTRKIAGSIPGLFFSDIASFYTATLPNVYNETVGQFAIRWDAPVHKSARRVLAELLELDEETYQVPNIAFFYVGQNHRRRRVGDAMMVLAHSLIETRGYDYSCLIVAADNQPARHLYEKHGYMDTGYRHFVRDFTTHNRDGVHISRPYKRCDLMYRPAHVRD